MILDTTRTAKTITLPAGTYYVGGEREAMKLKDRYRHFASASGEPSFVWTDGEHTGLSTTAAGEFPAYEGEMQTLASIEPLVIVPIAMLRKWARKSAEDAGTMLVSGVPFEVGIDHAAGTVKIEIEGCPHIVSTR